MWVNQSVRTRPIRMQFFCSNAINDCALVICVVLSDMFRLDFALIPPVFSPTASATPTLGRNPSRSELRRKSESRNAKLAWRRANNGQGLPTCTRFILSPLECALPYLLKMQDFKPRGMNTYEKWGRGIAIVAHPKMGRGPQPASRRRRAWPRSWV